MLVPFLRRSALAAGLTALVLSVPAAALAQPGAARAPRLSTSFQGRLDGVSGVPSTSKAWAVGNYCVSGCGTAAAVYDTLAEHYDGTSWSQVPSPSPSAADNLLTSVKALSDTNVWAVGSYCASGCGNPAEVYDTLILHWDGSTWTQIPSKNPSASFNMLVSVAAGSSSDVWAAGTKCDSGCTGERTLTEHWNGTAWSSVSSPDPSSQGSDVLTGVSSFPTHKAWAVGAAGPKTLVLRWTGTKWASVTSPNPSSADNELHGVSSPSATSAWAVGDYLAAANSRRTVALHWNGTKWSKASTPSPSSAFNVLQGVAARTGSDAWAVGVYCVSACGQQTEVQAPLIIHWNGSSWSQKAAHVSGAGYAALNGVSAHSSTDAWAVGVSCSSGCGTASEVDNPLIEHWNGSNWQVR